MMNPETKRLLENKAKGIMSVTGPIIRETPKVGRNAPCWCGSGKKYKKCCLKEEIELIKLARQQPEDGIDSDLAIDMEQFFGGEKDDE